MYRTEYEANESLCGPRYTKREEWQHEERQIMREEREARRQEAEARAIAYRRARRFSFA